MRDLVFALFFVLLGAGLGVIGLARWWTRKMRQPDHVRGFIVGMCRTSKISRGIMHDIWREHPVDPETVCETCGTWRSPLCDVKEIDP